ncbi:MAG TPA: glycosyltransferase [Candidatus Acidoferrales bacterium]|jgi:glycosyltransferase involved in cell wall biosynthesis|nr:glycosyltransferase [Candidatus Acidoferrales bacterium]
MKASILLPVYNAGFALHAAIESILCQDEPDFELLAVDDCSRDRSAEVIGVYAFRDPRVRAVYHSRNMGLSATLNEGLVEARSQFVVRMDQDDVALPNRLSTQLRFMRVRPEVAVAGTFVYHMGRTPAFDRLVKLPTEHAEIVAALANYNCLYHPSVILRKQEILALGGYRSAYKNSEDYDLWLRASNVYGLANIPVPLLRYRFSTAGMTLGKKWEQALFTRMAVVSWLHPNWSHEAVQREAAAELETMGRAWFLEQVAQGTIKELIQLGLPGDALRVLWKVSQQVGFPCMKRLAGDYIFELLAARSGGAYHGIPL